MLKHIQLKHRIIAIVTLRLKRSGPRCNARPVATGRVSSVCDWLRDATGLDFGDRSWICNAALVYIRVTSPTSGQCRI